MVEARRLKGQSAVLLLLCGMKIVMIEADFPELRAKYQKQLGKGQGSTRQSALAAATRDLLKQSGLKRMRFTTFTAKVTLTRAPD